MKTNEFIPVHNVYEGRFNAISGRLIDLLCPSAATIDIRDIAHALSNLCRFGGHSKLFYSVAQHSVVVAALAPAELQREALLHDATEAYVGDVIKPLKVLLGDVFETIETTFMRVIAAKFGLCAEKLSAVKRFDKMALELEHEAFQKDNESAQSTIRELTRFQLELDEGTLSLIEGQDARQLGVDPQAARYIFHLAFEKVFR